MMFVLLLFLTSAASARSFPGYDFGGKSHQQFLTEAIERSSPGNARLLAELFGGLELGLELGGGTKVSEAANWRRPFLARKDFRFMISFPLLSPCSGRHLRGRGRNKMPTPGKSAARFIARREREVGGEERSPL